MSSGDADRWCRQRVDGEHHQAGGKLARVMAVPFIDVVLEVVAWNFSWYERARQ